MLTEVAAASSVYRPTDPKQPADDPAPEQSRAVVARSEAWTDGPTGYVHDQKLIRWFYEKFYQVDTNPVTTDQFLNRSKKEYNAAWLSRELIQNFVDHNPIDPGTLNGVNIYHEVLPDGKHQFSLRGRWPFRSPTGVFSLHSDKPTDRHTAGGNGIGLKQAAIRLLRDFDASRFDIFGEGWAVQYRMAAAEKINEELKHRLAVSNEAVVPAQLVENDWLLADLHKLPEHHGQALYVIETENPELIAALEQLRELGVSKENPYLQDLDFENQYGALKWLPYTPDQVEKGRLFVNGQVMNYKTKGKTAADYWHGPEGVTVQLNNIAYDMNIDRPPMTSYDLERSVEKLIKSMTKDELIDQLKRSEYIWSQSAERGYSSDRPGALVVIDQLVSQLRSTRDYEPSQFVTVFGDKNYLANDTKSSTQADDLRKQGYVLCPDYFGRIGMPAASTKLSSFETAINQRPETFDVTNKLERLAEETGVQVLFEELQVRSARELLTSIHDRLAPQLRQWEEASPGIFRLYLATNISKELLAHSLPHPKNPAQELLHFLRGAAYQGLKQSVYADNRFILSQGEYVTNFATHYSRVEEDWVLVVRNVPHPSSDGTFIEFALPEKLAVQMRELLQTTEPGSVDSQGVSTDPQTDNQTQAPVKKSEEFAGQTEPEPATAATDDTSQSDYQSPGEKLRRTLDEMHEQRGQQSGQESTPSADAKEGDASRPNLADVAIEEPEFRGQAKEGRVITQEAQPTPEEAARIAALEQQLPVIKEVVEALDKIVPDKDQGAASPDRAANSPINQYLAWRASENFYGEAGKDAGYLSGRHLLELVIEYNQADIATLETTGDQPAAGRELSELNHRLQAISNRLKPADEQVEQFALVTEPTPNQLAKLAMLRAYMTIITGVALPNDLFIYDGTGTKGLNLAVVDPSGTVHSKAIGLHRELFKVGFSEVLSTMTHEMAHNVTTEHNNQFITTLQALFEKRSDKQQELIRKLQTDQALTTEEQMLTDIQARWEQLRD